MAVSYLSRMVIIREIGLRLGKNRPDASMKPRVFIWGFPGTGQTGNVDDLNAEKSYGAMSVHWNGVAGNEVLVLDSAKRYSNANFFGVRVCPKSSSSQTKLSEHEANRGEAEKSECVSGEIFKILGQAATAIEPSEGAFDDPPPW